METTSANPIRNIMHDAAILGEPDPTAATIIPLNDTTTATVAKDTIVI